VSCMILLQACAGSGGLAAQLAKTRGTLRHESVPSAEQRQLPTVSLGNVVVEARLPPATSVNRSSGWAVPLLFVNLWNAEYDATLGTAQLDTDLETFTRSCIADELRGRSRRAWAEQGGDLVVDVTVHKLTMSAPMRESGHLFIPVFFWLYYHAVYLGPAEVTLEAEVVVRRDGTEVVRHPIAASGRADPKSARNRRVDGYTLVMAAALSNAVERLGAQVVETVDGL
jgi:hypothetical protein